ncbi:TRAP transporter substrate-binding protein [Ancylobacter lacus]|uniref:TRAP transporter substrate-binding protein n=1 Tax=Ancylobacter lacus TaxID=2579970 RepID=UPI001BCA6DF8|nr:TRAP transporter substrate-binding protein [Ancylobacter lacus]MBS7538146.1 TRAP transporter substrate-binding protein [Ancylobacter lacus]
MALAFFATAGAARAGEAPAATVELQVVGGLAGVTQYTRFEQPFWTEEIEQRSQGRIRATIRPLDGGSLRAEEMLQLMRLGVVPFGTAIVTVVAGDEPELNAIDLPVLNPDIDALRRSVGLLRQPLGDMLRTRYGIELLGVYAYPAQVLFCTRAFRGLDDLAGRKIRTSSVGQSDFVGALGAVPVQVPFADILPALRAGVADCAITGTLSGYEIGLPGVASHVHAMAISWGVSVFGANEQAWEALPPDLRAIIRSGVADLEKRIWAGVERDTERGIACNTGRASSCGGPPGRMTLVPTSAADQARRRQLLAQAVLPRWIERCGPACTRLWDDLRAAAQGVEPQHE